MKEIRVKVIEEHKGHINPERRFHLLDLEKGILCIQNMREEEIERFAKAYQLTIAE